MTYQPQSPEPNPHGANQVPAGPPPQQGAPSDFATDFGLKEHPGRPKKVNQFTQLMWAYAAATVLVLVFAIIASATAPWWLGTGFIVGGSVFGLVIGALAVVVAWFVAKEKLGGFGAADPRTPLYIALGILGFFALGGFAGGWAIGWFAALTSLIALAKLGAVGAGFFLLTQPEVEQWLKSRPGNQPKPPVAPQGYPQQPPAPGYQQQQPPAPGYQQPPAPGQPQQPGQPPYPPAQ